MGSSELGGCAKHNIVRGKQKIILGIFIMGEKNRTKEDKIRQRINNGLTETHKYFMCFFLLGINNGCTTEMFS